MTQQWSLTLLGAGGGKKKAFRTSFTSSFSAEAGERKRVFLPVPALGTQVFRTRDRQLIPTKRSLVWGNPDAPGIELVSGSMDAWGPHKLTTFHLAGDTTGATAVFDYEYENSKTFSTKASIMALGSEVTADLSVQLVDTLRLKCLLVSGHDYALRDMPGSMGSALGVTWSQGEAIDWGARLLGLGAKRSPARRLDPPRRASHTRAALPQRDHDVSDGPQAIRREFIEMISKRGWWLGPGAKHIYYHDAALGAPRIVLRSTRIRFEMFNSKTSKYELWQSYRLVDEADLALRAVAQLKRRG